MRCGGQVHPALRAAAIEGLAGQPLDRLPDTLALVAAALEDDDPRIGLAAVATLDRSEAGKRALDDTKTTRTLSEPVRAAIDALTGVAHDEHDEHPRRGLGWYDGLISERACSA